VALRRNGAGEQRNGDASDSVSAESLSTFWQRTVTKMLYLSARTFDFPSS
jgi:hypothetical protein